MTTTPDRATSYDAVIHDISSLNWSGLSVPDISAVAWAYYFFSVQFRENLQIAFRQHPEDALLARLVEEECETDNLSPWPNVAAVGEALDHDEFMLRLLQLSPIYPDTQARIERLGQKYLDSVREVADDVRAASIASYEDGGLETVFTAVLRCEHWETPLLAAFRHFLEKHISFDSNPEQGHGALSRHLAVDKRICCLWTEFRDLLVASAPRLRA